MLLIDGVKPSRLGTQPVGEAAEVAEGVYQLKVPVPIPLVFVSAYLAEGDGGWTIIDTGFDYPEGRTAWESGAEAIGCNLGRDVERIVVTHFHPDHLGAAYWLQGISGAPVCMLGARSSTPARSGATPTPHRLSSIWYVAGWAGLWPRGPRRARGQTCRCRRRWSRCRWGRRSPWAPARPGSCTRPGTRTIRPCSTTRVAGYSSPPTRSCSGSRRTSVAGRIRCRSLWPAISRASGAYAASTRISYSRDTDRSSTI